MPSKKRAQAKKKTAKPKIGVSPIQAKKKKRAAKKRAKRG